MSQPSIKPVYALVGQEAFLKRQAIERIVKQALREDPDSLGPTTIDGESAELADALDELQTLSLLGGMRVVIVESADAFITRYRKQLEAYCASPSDSACLILLCKSMPRNTRLYKAVVASGEVVECAAVRPQQVGPWIVQRARGAYSKLLDNAAAARLYDLVGNGLEALDNELSKLSVYVGSREQIGIEDIEALVGQHREEAVFRVTDAMAAGDVEAALRAWEHVLATDRAAPVRAIGGLASAVRRLLEAKQAQASGESLQSMVNRRLAPNAAMLARRLDSVSAEELKRQLCDLCDADLASKTGLGDIASAIETYVVKHTRPRASRPGSRVGGRG